MPSKLKKNKILPNRGGNISNCYYSSMSFSRNFLLHHTSLKVSIWLQAESSLHLKISLNNAQTMYYQPWNVTMSARGEQETQDYLRENKLPFTEVQGQRQAPACSPRMQQDLQRKGNELVWFLLHERNLLHRNNKWAQIHKKKELLSKNIPWLLMTKTM